MDFSCIAGDPVPVSGDMAERIVFGTASGADRNGTERTVSARYGRPRPGPLRTASLCRTDLALTGGRGRSPVESNCGHRGMRRGMDWRMDGTNHRFRGGSVRVAAVAF